MAERSCPHDDKRFCPLYHAMHVVGAISCLDGEIHLQTCAVDRRRMDYAGSVAALRVTHPRLVGEVEMLQAREKAKAQRNRNMRLLGIS